MKIRTKIIIIGLCGFVFSMPTVSVAETCAKGQGIEIKGNSSGTYCRSRVAMNWWSAHAWCDSVGMKLVTTNDCICSDESKCDMTVACPNLYHPSESVGVWTATTQGSSAAYRVLLVIGSVLTYTRTFNYGRALCL